MNTPIQNKTNERTTRMLTGTVVSTKMKDTVVVEVTRYKKFPKYGKFLVRTMRIKAHDAGNTCSVGDVVFLKPTRPISKDKNYAVAGKKSAAAKADIDVTDIAPTE